MRAAIALAIVFGWVMPAHAGNDVGVVVIGHGAELSLISAHFEEWLGKHGRTVVPAPIPPAAITEIVDCFALEHPSCARNAVDGQTKASTIVIVRVAEKQGATREIALTVYWFDKGHAAIVEHARCERSSNTSLSSTTDTIMTKLARAALGALGHVNFRSSPPGARITIDGTSVGVTPLDWELPVGKHAIRMTLDKHEPQQRPVTVRADATEVVKMSLDASTDHVRSKNRDSVLLRVVPVTAMGAGAAAIILGGVLIAIDQNDDRRAPPIVRNSAPTGAVISVVGAAVAGAGAYLWFRRPEAKSSPVAAVARDAAYIGWLGRF
jgi:PEGA domain